MSPPVHRIGLSTMWKFNSRIKFPVSKEWGRSFQCPTGLSPQHRVRFCCTPFDGESQLFMNDSPVVWTMIQETAVADITQGLLATNRIGIQWSEQLTDGLEIPKGFQAWLEITEIESKQ